MPRYNNQNIDRKTNKPNAKTNLANGDRTLNRAEQVRRDDDIIRTPKRTIYDIDYAIKWYLDNEIQPQITHQKELINVPVIFANGEKWDNVQRLGYIRDEKGMLQSPIIMIKRNSTSERDFLKTLDVNNTPDSNKIIHKIKYNSRNRYEDELFPMPINNPQNSEKIYVVDIPKYVLVEYDLMLWCDFTTQINELVDQMLPHNRFAWGNEHNKFNTFMGAINFETINTVGEDRLVRATIPITVHGTLQAEQESRISTIQKMYSIKKVRFDSVIDVGVNLFETTQVPVSLLRISQQIFSGGTVVVSGGGSTTPIDSTALTYIINLTDYFATYVSADTVTISGAAAINPTTNDVATKNEFDVYINGQYIDKSAYTWTPASTSPQTIQFDTGILAYEITATDVIVVNGRWQ